MTSTPLLVIVAATRQVGTANISAVLEHHGKRVDRVTILIPTHNFRGFNLAGVPVYIVGPDIPAGTYRRLEARGARPNMSMQTAEP